MVGTAAAVVLWVGLGDVLGQSQLLDSGRSWLIRVALVEAGWAALLALPVNWLYARAARHSRRRRAGGRHQGQRRRTRQAGRQVSAPKQPSLQLRLTILLVVVACLFAALFARLWFLQVMNAPKAQAAAENNGIRLVYTQAPRGLIEDRNGHVLVGNVNEPVIEVSRLVASQNPGMVARLAPLLGMTVPQLKKAINNLQYSPYAPVPVMPDATPEQILYVQENQGLFPGVQATTMSVRTYSAMGKAAANIVGYVGQISPTQYQKLKVEGYQPGDQIGLAGVEAEYESILRGTPGVQKLQVDSRGNVLTTISTTQPVPGDDLRLTIDGNIQMIAETALEQGLVAARHTFDHVDSTRRNFSAPAGSAVVEDPRNGQVLALATNPDLRPGRVRRGHQSGELSGPPQQPQRPAPRPHHPGPVRPRIDLQAHHRYRRAPDRAHHPLDGLRRHGVDHHRQLHRSQRQRGCLRPDHPAHRHHGVERQLLQQHRPQPLVRPRPLRRRRPAERGQAVRPGKSTGIALPNEAAGKIPTPESYISDHQANPSVFIQAQWYPGNSDQVAIGQDEVLVTPFQLANAYAAFANGGNLLAPQLTLAAENPTTHRIVPDVPGQAGPHHQPPARLAGGHAPGVPGRRQ